MTTINSPVKLTGRTYIGPLILDFKDGVAEYDGDLNDGVRQYMLANGYGIDVPSTPPTPVEPVDSRTIPTLVEGAPLRDAAVDPRPGDYLPPTNAGQEDPHGPKVVAPGVHAANVGKPIHPGDVTSDDAQAAKETALAQDVLVDQTPVPEATAKAAGTTAEDGPFDPGAHTVAEVTDYLATADDTEKARVIAAEQAGKNRTGIVGQTT